MTRERYTVEKTQMFWWGEGEVRILGRPMAAHEFGRNDFSQVLEKRGNASRWNEIENAPLVH
jgi:hypothetical protein